MLKLRIRRDGKTVWQGNNDEPIVKRDAFLNAQQARVEGEVTIQYWNGTHWKRWALLCQWPLPEGI